jgi:hypothetical protein
LNFGLGGIYYNELPEFEWRLSVIKKYLVTSLICLMFTIIISGQIFSTDAVALFEVGVETEIDEQIKEAILVSPQREATFIVRLHPEGNGGAEKAIDAQFRLEKTLALLVDKGSVRAFQAFYGENVIKVTGGFNALNFLANWPEMDAILAYQPGEDWELRTRVHLDSEEIDGSGQITGKVTESDGITPLAGIRVTVYMQTSPNSWSQAGSVLTNASGEYTISSLDGGFYRARFEDPSGNYVTEYYDNKISFNLATNFTVVDGGITTNINGSLQLAGKITGTITLVAGGSPASDVIASAWSNATGSWMIVSSNGSAMDGTYEIGGLSPGNHKIKFADIYDPPRYLDEWYDNVLTVDLAQDVFVTAGSTTTNINAAMGSYGSVKGNVKAYDGETNLENIYVDVYRFESDYSSWEWFNYGGTDSSGNFVINGLSTENYRVAFSDPLNQFADEFYNDKPDLDSADNISVSLGYATLNINAQLGLKTDTMNNVLVSGWNLISLPVTLTNTTPSSAFASLSSNYGDVWAYDACDVTDHWKVFNPDVPAPVNDLTNVGVTAGYWIKISSPGTLSLSGTHPLTTVITLCPGWNLIGYPSLTARPVGTVLASIAGKYTLVRQYNASDQADPWKSFNPALPPDNNDLVNMTPGYGYWIYMTQAASLAINGR